jgi:hypothetical protein
MLRKGLYLFVVFERDRTGLYGGSHGLDIMLFNNTTQRNTPEAMKKPDTATVTTF